MVVTGFGEAMWEKIRAQADVDDVFISMASSLSYLKKFDIDFLKIDRSFIRNLATDPNDRVLSEAIIMMGHQLGLKVIAEGVETEEQRNFLLAAGYDYAQGYLYATPIPPKEFERLLISNIVASGHAMLADLPALPLMA